MDFLKEAFFWFFNTPFKSLSIVFAIILFLLTYRLAFNLFRVIEIFDLKLSKKDKINLTMFLINISSIAYLILIFGILLSNIYRFGN